MSVKAIGVDIVDVERFEHFYLYHKQQLLRIFSPHEIAYCLKEPSKSAERFAVRYAAKEALYKALSQIDGIGPYPFLTLCQHVEIVLCPFPTIHQRVPCVNDTVQLLVSLSHSKHMAVAYVLVQEKNVICSIFLN